MLIQSFDRRDVSSYLSQFSSWYRNNHVVPVSSIFGNMIPKEMMSLHQKVSHLVNEVGAKNDEYYEVDEMDIPLFKRVLLYNKRIIAEEQEIHRSKTTLPELLDRIDERMKLSKRLLADEKIIAAIPLSVPPLTKYLTLQAAYSVLPNRVGAPELKYDEKFGILQTPANFLPMLNYHRLEGSLRGTGVGLAYIDIDDFKRFNTAYGETFVDRQILPIIMQAMESHVFSHGTAFRFGGDEYTFILPNISKSFSESYLFELQEKLSLLKFEGVDDAVSVSIGFCQISTESSLTDKECLDAANMAKDYAKKQGGKNCIAVYKSESFRREDLYISPLSDRVAE